MGFMANDISGVLVSHRPEQESARCAGRDGYKVLKGLCEREKEEEEKERSRLEETQDKSREIAKKGGAKGRSDNRLTSGTMVSVALRSAAISITIASEG